MKSSILILCILGLLSQHALCQRRRDDPNWESEHGDCTDYEDGNNNHDFCSADCGLDRNGNNVVACVACPLACVGACPGGSTTQCSPVPATPAAPAPPVVDDGVEETAQPAPTCPPDDESWEFVDESNVSWFCSDYAEGGARANNCRRDVGLDGQRAEQACRTSCPGPECDIIIIINGGSSPGPPSPGDIIIIDTDGDDLSSIIDSALGNDSPPSPSPPGPPSPPSKRGGSPSPPGPPSPPSSRGGGSPTIIIVVGDELEETEEPRRRGNNGQRRTPETENDPDRDDQVDTPIGGKKKLRRNVH